MFEKRSVIWLTLLSVLAFGLTRYGLIYGAGSDPRYTLIVSQALLQHGTVALNAYQDDLIWGEPADFDHNFNIIERNGRYDNYFPVGPSLLSVPFVAVANGRGWDMRQAADNVNAQRLLSSLSVVAVLWLLFAIAQTYLSGRDSLVITAVFLLGTTLISTLGVALWSINYSVLFIAAALLLLVRYDAGHSPTVHPLWLGLLLFLAYFSRAAAAPFIVATFGYLLLKDWRMWLKTAVVSGALLALFLLWNRAEFGTWLPIYYSAARLTVTRGSPWLALWGLLLSPARGLLIYTPTAVLLIPALYWIQRQPLAWLAVGWLGLHLLIVVRSTVWWGGDTFGPRILTELMLALFLLTILAWRDMRAAATSRTRRSFAVAFALLGLFGIWLHSYQGLYNTSTSLWNVVASHQPRPPYTSTEGDLFSWRYAQLAASNPMLCHMAESRTRQLVATQPILRPYRWGEPIEFDERTAVSLKNIPPANSAPAALIGWAAIDNDRARTRELFCDTAQVLFEVADVAERPYELVISSAAFGTQRVQVLLNGTAVGEVTFTQQPGLVAEMAVLPLPAALFQPNGRNELTLRLPNAHRFSLNDPSRTSLAIAEIAIRSIAIGRVIFPL